MPHTSSTWYTETVTFQHKAQSPCRHAVYRFFINSSSWGGGGGRFEVLKSKFQGIHEKFQTSKYPQPQT